MENRIGIVGVGLLGQAIAERFLSAGWSVFGHDRQELDQFQAIGGVVCSSVAELAGQTKKVILCLPNSSISKQVVKDMLPHLQSHAVFDVTTGEPDDAQVIERELRKHGSSYLDLTVAGSSEQMRSHQATLLIGCTDEDYESNQEVFRILGAKSFLVGAVGKASEMKLVVNLAIGLHRAVLAEALAFGERLGFDGEQVVEVLQNTPARSAAMDAKAQKMLRADFVPQARLQQHLKDVKLILSLAEREHATVPLSQLHATLLESLVDAGYGDLDNSVVVQAFRNPAVLRDDTNSGDYYP